MFDKAYAADFSARKGALADNMFVQRWSPRAFEKTSISQDVLNQIFDAARLAPSAYNSQPWRIFSSQADGSDFQRFLRLLVKTNQVWAQNASVLGFMIAAKNFAHNGKENHWALYDCGFAWASLTFQANQMGLYTHGMAGIMVDEIYAEFAIPRANYTVVAGFAIGKLAKPEILPEAVKKREIPSARKALTEIYFPGGTQL